MSFSEGWEWLGEEPEWDPPAELRQPTQVWMHNLVISMLSSGILGNDSLCFVGELLTKYAAFNSWVSGEAKSVLDASELLARAGALDTIGARTYEAWDAYRTWHEAAGRAVGAAEQERHALVDTLRSAVAELDALRRPGRR